MKIIRVAFNSSNFTVTLPTVGDNIQQGSASLKRNAPVCILLMTLSAKKFYFCVI